MSNERPPFDPELEAVVAAIASSAPATVTADMIPELRRVEMPGASRAAVEGAGLVARRDGPELRRN